MTPHPSDGPVRTAFPATILVVDDEVLLRESLKDVLAHLGFRVLEAPDGPSGLALLQDRGTDIHLVILDMTMPGMHGTEVLGRIRAMPGPIARVPVVLASGYSGAEVPEDLSRQAPTSFLRKPFSMTDLARRISEHLLVDGRPS